MTAMRNMGSRQGGFTLVEMMVAMLLGILILLAVSEVFVSNNRTRIEIENTTRQIENGRYAMQLLEGELANAGFFGELAESTFSSLPPACVSDSTEAMDSLAVPVYGGEEMGTECRGDNIQAESDYLAIRRSSTCVVGSTDCGASGAYLLRVSACQSSAPGIPAIADSTVPEEMSALIAVTDRSCSDPAPTYSYINRLYFLSGDNVLMRAELGAGVPVPLVDGIERLHFAYGLDDNGDGAVDRFLDADDVDLGQLDASGVVAARWDNVVAIRIWLLARNLEPASDPSYKNTHKYDLGPGGIYSKEDSGDAFDDRFKRQLYTSTVRLNNVAGRRESPALAGAASAEEPPAETPPAETPSDPAI